MGIENYWTDDFEEFKRKVESAYGALELIEKDFPDIYPHAVLAHGFMEYAGVRKLFDKVRDRVTKEKGSFNSKNEEHDVLHHRCLLEEYKNWAKENIPNLSEELLEQGWKEFLED